jgi:hypothetical protein
VKFVDGDERDEESSENDNDLLSDDNDEDSDGEDGGLFVNPLSIGKTSKKNGKST